MKAITLHQPWASLVAANVKQLETRSWKTSYRGPLVIHAGQQAVSLQTLPPAFERKVLKVLELEQFSKLWDAAVAGHFPLGVAVAACRLSDVFSAEAAKRAYKDQRPWGLFSPGRFAWALENILPIKPNIPLSGKQGLWTIPEIYRQQILNSLPNAA